MVRNDHQHKGSLLASIKEYEWAFVFFGALNFTMKKELRELENIREEK